jgi:hypothetical protein
MPRYRDLSFFRSALSQSFLQFSHYAPEFVLHVPGSRSYLRVRVPHMPTRGHHRAPRDGPSAFHCCHRHLVKLLASFACRVSLKQRRVESTHQWATGGPPLANVLFLLFSVCVVFFVFLLPFAVRPGRYYARAGQFMYVLSQNCTLLDHSL